MLSKGGVALEPNPNPNLNPKPDPNLTLTLTLLTPTLVSTLSGHGRGGVAVDP